MILISCLLLGFKVVGCVSGQGELSEVFLQFCGFFGLWDCGDLGLFDTDVEVKCSGRALSGMCARFGWVVW